MAFWVYVDVSSTGEVNVSTYPVNGVTWDGKHGSLRTRKAATVSQALRKLAASMVYAKAETVGQKDKP